MIIIQRLAVDGGSSVVHPDLAYRREFKKPLYDLGVVVAGVTLSCKVALPAGVLNFAFFVRCAVLVVISCHIVMCMVSGDRHQRVAINCT